jgi:hypothetical protein
MARSSRGTALTVFAVLFGVLAVSNLAKPLQIGSETGFVLLGKRLSGLPNMIFGPLFGLYLAAYATGIWGMRHRALPMGIAYAAYVVVNLVLFTVRSTPPPGRNSLLFGLVYMAVAIGVSSGAAVLLWRRRDELT